MKIRLLIAVLALFSARAFSQVTCYAITPSTSGTGTGASWTNAHGGTPTLTRGTRYYFADGSYSGFTFSTAASGTTTIEYRKAQAYDYGRTSDGCSNDISAGWNAATMGSAQAKFARTINIDAPYFTFNGNGKQTAPGCGGGGGMAGETFQNVVGANPPNITDCGMVIDDTTCSSNCARVVQYNSGPFTVEYTELRGNPNPNVDEDNFVQGSGSGPNLWLHIYGHATGAVYFQYGSGRTVQSSYFWGTETQGPTVPDDTHGQFSYDDANSNNVDVGNIYRDITGSSVYTHGIGGTNTAHLFYDNIYFWSPNGAVTTTTGASGSCPANCVSVTSGNNLPFSAGQTVYIGSAIGSATGNVVSTVYSPTLMSLTTTPSTVGSTHYWSVTFGGVSDAIFDCINGASCNNFVMVQNTIINCFSGAVFGNACGNVGLVYYDGGGTGNFTWENNLLYNNVGTMSFAIASGSSFTATTDYGSYLNSPLPTCTGTCSGNTSNVHVASGSPNPFTNWELSDFSLATDNADWNNRVSLGSPYTVDAAGVTFTTDRGAYQFTTGTQATVPSCSPGTGTYSSTQTVTCTNPNSGTTVMCYTTNGSTPVTNGSGTACTTGTVYTTTISVSSSETLTVVAGTSTLTDSNSVAYIYTISSQAATPVISPGAGTYNNNQTPSITSSSGGTVAICYTVDGSLPITNGAGTGCTHGALLSNGGTVTVSGSETLSAVAGTSSLTDSSRAQAIFTMVVAAPSFSPVAGNYSSATSVTISTTTLGATLHYAINATPTCASTTYSSPVSISTSETLEAIGCLANFSSSSITSGSYTIGGIVNISGNCSLAQVLTGTSPSPTFSCTPFSAGDALVFLPYCHASSGSTPTGITMSAAGWSFYSIGSLLNRGDAAPSAVAQEIGSVAPNTSATTFTVNFTGASNCSTFASVMVLEFSGTNPAGGASTFDASGGTGGQASTCNQTLNVTPASNNNAVVMFCQDTSTGVTGAWNSSVTDTNGDYAGYQILSGGSGTAFNPGFVSTSGAYIVAGVAISPVGSAVPLTVIVNGTGTVTSSPAGISCPGTCSAAFSSGTVVTLTITNGLSSNWLGACYGSGQVCSLTLTANTSTQINFGCGPPSFNCSTHSTAVATLPSLPNAGTSVGVNTKFYEYSTILDFYYPAGGIGNCITRLTDANSNGNKSFVSTWSQGGNDLMWSTDRSYGAIGNSGGGIQYLSVSYDNNGCMTLNNPVLGSPSPGGTTGGFSFSRTVGNRAYHVLGSTGSGTQLNQETLSGTNPVTFIDTVIFDFSHCPGVPASAQSIGGNGALSVSSDDNIFSTSLNLGTVAGQGNAHWILAWNRSTNQCASYYTGQVLTTENPANGNIWAYCGPGDCSQGGSNPAPIALNTVCAQPGYGIHDSFEFGDGLYERNSGMCNGTVNSHNNWKIGANSIQTCNDSLFSCGGHGSQSYSRFFQESSSFNYRQDTDLTTFTNFYSASGFQSPPALDQHGSLQWPGASSDNGPWLMSTFQTTLGDCSTRPYCKELLAMGLDGTVARFINTFDAMVNPSDLGAVSTMTPDGYCMIFQSDWNQTLGTDSGSHPRLDIFAACNLDGRPIHPASVNPVILSKNSDSNQSVDRGNSQ